MQLVIRITPLPDQTMFLFHISVQTSSILSFAKITIFDEPVGGGLLIRVHQLLALVGIVRPLPGLALRLLLSQVVHNVAVNFLVS